MMLLSCSLTPAQSICLALLSKLSLSKSLYGLIHWVAVRTLRRSFILFDELWCSFLQMNLGYPTCVGRIPILLNHVIVSGVKSSAIQEKIVIQ